MSAWHDRERPAAPAGPTSRDAGGRPPGAGGGGGARARAPRRVLYISDARGPGGAEVYLTRLAGALDRSRFTPAALLDPSPALDATARAFESVGAPVVRLRVAGALDVAGLARLTRAVRASGADIAHVNLPSTYDAACSLFLVAARSAGARVVTTEHVVAIGRSRRRRLVKSAATRAARRVITISRANVGHLARHGVPAGKVRLVGNGVPDPGPTPPEERARRRARFPLAEGALLLGAVGSLIERKGHALLLEALAALSGRLAFHLAVVGDGEERAALEAAAARLGLARDVTFLGRVDDAAPWIAALDLHVLASRLEGMPLCVLEAMAARVPTVAFAIDGMSEVVEDGATGVLAPGRTAAALAEAIAIAADPVRRCAMGKAARERYEERFTLEAMARATEAVYEEALA